MSISTSKQNPVAPPSTDESVPMQTSSSQNVTAPSTSPLFAEPMPARERPERFQVLPSSALKSPHFNRRCFRSQVKPNATLSDAEKLDHLTAAEYKATTVIALARARRLTAQAEEMKALKELYEIRLLQQIAKEGAKWSSLNPQSALDLGHAVRDTLEAEERLAEVQVEECEKYLTTLRDASEEAQARVADAVQQIGMLLNAFQKLRMQRLDYATKDLVPDYKFDERFPSIISRSDFGDADSHSDIHTSEEEEEDNDDDDDDDDDDNDVLPVGAFNKNYQPQAE